MKALLTDYYNQQQRELQIAGLTGAFQGQKTLAGQQFDSNQQQQQWENRFNFGQATGTFANGQQTTQQQQFQYQQERDKITDQKDKEAFDEDARRYGLNYAIDQQQVRISQQNANTSSASQGNSAGNANFNKLMDVWAATGKAPDGLQAYGIQPDAAYKPDSGKAVPYDQTPEWAQEIAALNGDPKGTYDDLIKNSTDYISDYTYDGYQKLLSQALSMIK